MESPEEAIGSNSSESGEFAHAAVVVKGKRTKRQRLHQPALETSTAAVADSSSASSADIEVPSGSVTEEEEEEMANCLILLAQGHALDGGHPKPRSLTEEPTTAAAAGGGSGGGIVVAEKFISRRFSEAATTTDGKAGYYVYECKTCSKCFPSFQALGGHRASHKKPKLVAMKAGDKKQATIDEHMLQISMNSNFCKAMAANNPTGAKPKVHECSICGAEFSSGQALGGHMRRHRPLVTADHPNMKQEEGKKDNRICHHLSLDLNLPAPSDDELRRPASPNLSLNIKHPIVFSSPAPAATTSSALVDCHY